MMYKSFFKRALDLICALMALPFWFILLVVIAPIIYLEDRGSVFYNAPRLGKDGKVFKMYKFRSMKMNAPDIRNEDGSTYNAADDPRLLRFGKFLRKTSLDETPQLINIIKGDMSIIGPRPDLPDHFHLYEDNESHRLAVRPGVTGYNQAYFRNAVSWKERIANDLYYVDHLSFWFDVKIFFRTFVTVLKQDFVYVSKKQRKVKLDSNKSISG